MQDHTVDLSEFKEEEIDVEQIQGEVFRDLPNNIRATIKRFNEVILSINGYEDSIDQLTPYHLSKLELLYNKAERESWRLAGYFKAQYQMYVGQSKASRSDYYIHSRETNNFAVNDSNYRSVKAEGEELKKAGIYEGFYVTYKGQAHSFEGARLSIGHMIKAIGVEGGGNH